MPLTGTTAVLIRVLFGGATINALETTVTASTGTTFVPIILTITLTNHFYQPIDLTKRRNEYFTQITKELDKSQRFDFSSKIF